MTDRNPPGAAETGGAVELLAAEVPMSEHVKRFWHLLETEHVRILIDARQEHTGDTGVKWFHWNGSSFPDEVAKALVADHRAPAVSSQAGEAVAWRIKCTQSGATGYLYTEQLPFDPGPGVRVRAEPEPLYTSPTPAPGGMELADELDQCRLFKEVPGLGTFLLHADKKKQIVDALRTAAQSAVRERTIAECAKIAAERGWMTGRDIAEEIRSLAGVKR